MGRYAGGLSFHTKLTLTIAGAFIGAIAVILLIGLLAARSLGIGVIALNQTILWSVPVATPMDQDSESIAVVSAASAEAFGTGGDDVLLADSDDTISIVVGTEAGVVTEVAQTPLERLPTLVRWSVIVLIVFALMAVVIASWISRRSLNRIAEITRLAQGLSESNLGHRLNLPGPDDEIKRLGDTFDRMLVRLESGFERQRQFVANASHELRTPLTTARVALEIPLVQGSVPAELEPSLQRALRANARSEQLIAALLGLARAQHGDPDAVWMTALAVVVHEVIAEREAFAASRRITLHLAVKEGVAVMGDPVLLDLAVGNLVENAIRHNHDGGEVWVTLATDGENAALTATNTGEILTGPLDRLREPFYRDAATRTQARDGAQGFGIGLALVDSVVRLHGGTLHLDVRDGGGMIVSVRIPLARGDA